MTSLQGLGQNSCINISSRCHSLLPHPPHQHSHSSPCWVTEGKLCPSTPSSEFPSIPPRRKDAEGIAEARVSGQPCFYSRKRCWAVHTSPARARFTAFSFCPQFRGFISVLSFLLKQTVFQIRLEKTGQGSSSQQSGVWKQDTDSRSEGNIIPDSVLELDLAMMGPRF